MSTINKKYKFVDLFAGASGLGVGMSSRFKHVLGLDNCDDAIKTSQLNGFNVVHCDINNVTNTVDLINHTGHPDIICGGSPCQSFSKCSNHFDPKIANLTIKFAEVVTTIKPTMFILENTPNAPMYSQFKIATETLLNNGYDILRLKIDSSRCGSPQLRVRIFQIGIQAKPNSLTVLKNIKKKVMCRMAHANIAVLSDVLKDCPRGLWMYPRNYNCKTIFGPSDTCPTIRTMCLTPKPSPNSKLYYIEHPQNTCKLRDAINPTCALIAAIQGFPSSYKFHTSSRNRLQRQLGNAVPVQVSKYLAKLAYLILTNVDEHIQIQRKGILIL